MNLSYARYYISKEDRDKFTIFSTPNEAREAVVKLEHTYARDINVGRAYDKDSGELLGYIVSYTVTRTL